MPDESLDLVRVSRELVCKVAEKSFDGHLPQDSLALVEAIARTFPPEMTEAQREEPKPFLFAAICWYRAAQDRLPL